MIEIMKRELLTLSDRIIEDLDYDGTVKNIYEIDKDEYSIQFKVSVDYDVKTIHYEFSPPETQLTRDGSSCEAMIILWDDGIEVSSSDWEDLSTFMDANITHYKL